MPMIDLEYPKPNIALIVMNHGDNRLSPNLVKDMMAALDLVEKNSEIRSVLLTGRDPKFFSNGLDLEWMMGHLSKPEALQKYLSEINALYQRWTLFPKPTVAVLNGHTFAAGFFLAAHLDFRLMRRDRGWCSLPEVKINIPLLPGMIAICQEVMPPQSFRKFYYTGQRFTGPEAKAMGFVDEVYDQEDLLSASIQWAEELGRAKTATYAEMKRRIRAHVAKILEEEDPKHFLSTLQFALP